MTSQSFGIIWDGIVILSCAAAWITQGILFRQIKKSYPQKWVDIGEPGLKRVFSLDQSKFRKASLTFNYLLRGDTELDKDLKIRKLWNLTRFVYLGILVVIIIFVISVFIINPS